MVMLHIKLNGITKCNNMVANILPADPPFHDPVGQKDKIQLFQNMVMLHIKGALAWYGKLTWQSAHAWILKILCYLIVWGITLIFMVRLSFYAIPLLIYDVMNDITIIP